jgi:hypothetical protein
VPQDQGYINDNRPKIRLGLTRLMELIANFLSTDPNTTNQFDIGYDALMLGTSDMYWELQDSELVIQAIPNFNDDQIIPVGIN